MDTPSTKKRVLLIQVAMDHRFADSGKDDFELGVGIVTRGGVTPLACAVLAALTPADAFEVDIWDEDLHGQIHAETPFGRYDIVGVSVLFSAVAYQARFLGMLFQRPGTTVVTGGPAVSAAPEDFRAFFDVVFVNEAERTWPQFLRDHAAGTFRPEYRQVDKPSLDESPPPRWDAMAAHIPNYIWSSVQTTRGCPFDCEFCDVIYLYGRRQRHKPVSQVITEVRTLEALGARGIFFTDDEFIGNPKYTKELLRAFIPVNNSFRSPLPCFTQLTMNLSRDEELLELVADANFYTAVLGIESLNNDSLRETRKHQNIRKDIIADIRKIQSYGIGARGSFIVGFDHDGPDTFDLLYQGIQAACIPWAVVGTLYAPENTPLWARLRSEGRIAGLRRPSAKQNAALGLNFIPKRMSRIELLVGYRSLMQRLNTWEACCERLRGWVSTVERPPRVVEEQPSEAMSDRLLADATVRWGLSPRDRDDLGDTLAHARQEAPFLLKRLFYFIFRCRDIQRRFQQIFQGYDALLAAERDGEIVPDQRAILVPENLGEALSDFFPAMYARLAASVPDRALVPEAAREVIVDFVVRWGAKFERIELQDEVFLLELCDRAAAKRGGTPTAVSAENERSLAQWLRRERLLDAILKDVRDELVRIAPA